MNIVFRVITMDQGKRLADSWNALFVESSAKQNEVSQIIYSLKNYAQVI